VGLYFHSSTRLYGVVLNQSINHRDCFTFTSQIVRDSLTSKETGAATLQIWTTMRQLDVLWSPHERRHYRLHIERRCPYSETSSLQLGLSSFFRPLHACARHDDAHRLHCFNTNTNSGIFRLPDRHIAGHVARMGEMRNQLTRHLTHSLSL
jgi:hypothetical protein